MSSKLLFILLLEIFGLAMTDPFRQKKIDLIARAIKEVHDRSIKRQLQENTDTTPANSTEDGSAPIKTRPQTNKPNAAIQIVKFHNVQANGKKIHVEAFFFFLKRLIASEINFTLRIAPNSRRMRNLADEAEAVPTTCKIKDEAKANTIDETGEKVDYNCDGEAKNDIDPNNVNITLNTDVPMTVTDSSGVSTVGFDDVNFRGNSSEQASNLLEVQPENPGDQINLKDVDIESNNKDSFTLKGKVEPADGLKNGDSFDLTVPNGGKDEPATVTCEVQTVNNGEVTMECKPDTDLNSQMSDFHNVATTVNGKNLDIAVKGGMTNTKHVSTGEYYNPTDNTSRYYRKSSSGLSGGAIAGIVIACVVALAAASIAAIMLRKPAPPIDNTTVVGLKTVENI